MSPRTDRAVAREFTRLLRRIRAAVHDGVRFELTTDRLIRTPRARGPLPPFMPDRLDPLAAVAHYERPELSLRRISLIHLGTEPLPNRYGGTDRPLSPARHAQGIVRALSDDRYRATILDEWRVRLLDACGIE